MEKYKIIIADKYTQKITRSDGTIYYIEARADDFLYELVADANRGAEMKSEKEGNDEEI